MPTVLTLSPKVAGNLSLAVRNAGSFPLKCSANLVCSDSLPCSETGLSAHSAGTLTLTPRT